MVVNEVRNIDGDNLLLKKQYIYMYIYMYTDIYMGRERRGIERGRG